MMTQLTPRLLSAISNDIAQGRALWGLLRANEYLNQESPLHKALVYKAKLAFKSDGRFTELGDLVAEVISGKTMQELSPEFQDCAKEVSGNFTASAKKHRYIPTFETMPSVSARSRRVRRAANQ